jgi:hypothetical protein
MHVPNYCGPKTARALGASPDLPPGTFRWPAFALGLVQVFLQLSLEALAERARVLRHLVKCLLRFLGHKVILRRCPRHVLAMLGITSRVELARVAADYEIA